MVVCPAVGVPVRMGLALCGALLCVLGRVDWRTVVLAVALWPVSGLGVTAGVHRLWTHGSYRPTLFMEALLLLLYSMADQGQVAAWCLTHKAHHRHSDTDQDPHNRNRGFWYSHFAWVFDTDAQIEFEKADVRHFASRYGELIRAHDRHSLWWDPLCSLGLPALLASCWGDTLGGLLVAGALRWMVVQHFTFFVNSVAHGPPRTDGRQFDGGAGESIGPRTSLLVTICALGEGWHDYHHAFPWDYAAAELDAWDQWNPTKMFIDACYHLGLCTDRRRCAPRNQLSRRHRLGKAAEPAGSPSVQDGSEVYAMILSRADPTAAVLAEGHLGGAGAEGRAALDEQYEVRGWPFMRYRARKLPNVEGVVRTDATETEGERRAEAYPVGTS